MPNERGARPIWAKWRIDDAGGVEVVATYRAPDGFTRQEFKYASLELAVDELGESFKEVVDRVLEVGGGAGRWRP